MCIIAQNAIGNIVSIDLQIIEIGRQYEKDILLILETFASYTYRLYGVHLTYYVSSNLGPMNAFIRYRVLHCTA